MDHYSTYLQGHPFALFTDHKPLEKLVKVHNKPLTQLQEVMQTYDFEIVYWKESEMPANYLFWNLVITISWEPKHLQQEQEHNLQICHLQIFLLHQELPTNTQLQSLMWLYKKDSFIEDSRVWRMIKRQLEPSQVVLFLSKCLVP